MTRGLYAVSSARSTLTENSKWTLSRALSTDIFGQPYHIREGVGRTSGPDSTTSRYSTGYGTGVVHHSVGTYKAISTGGVTWKTLCGASGHNALLMLNFNINL